ncbi:hypothetical protein SKAU_G00422610 [Synaphobranchus kaupii]|uniref:Uncharacterized protein n=1 Tax=Synaphobranchus kaupii TaxID=118154 RepID=A0A9Q1E6Z0_SYNKA|nr:hypothetical protein SKAU_G00422610 [Synaphobranchus kaupii]
MQQRCLKGENPGVRLAAKQNKKDSSPTREEPPSFKASSQVHPISLITCMGEGEKRGARPRVTPQCPEPRRATEHHRVKWPEANEEWRLQFDEDADSILEAMAKGEADRCLQTMTTIIVSLAAERFGLEKRTVKL